MVGTCRKIVISPEGFDTWFQVFRTIQAAEVWANVGVWLKTVNPTFGPGIRERLNLPLRLLPKWSQLRRSNKQGYAFDLAETTPQFEALWRARRRLG
jgi:hypothetical protein